MSLTTIKKLFPDQSEISTLPVGCFSEAGKEAARKETICTLQLSIVGSFAFCTGFNKDEGSLFVFAVVANLTEAAVEEDPYGSFVYSATYLGTTYRVIRVFDTF